LTKEARPVIHHMKSMKLMIHRLKKTTSMTASSSQKLSEMRHWNFYITELREKSVSFYDVNWQYITKTCQNCHVSVCSKFSQLCFCQIWFEFVITKIKRMNFLLRQCM